MTLIAAYLYHNFFKKFILKTFRVDSILFFFKSNSMDDSMSIYLMIDILSLSKKIYYNILFIF